MESPLYVKKEKAVFHLMKIDLLCGENRNIPLEKPNSV
jgi:hypothetical protein